MFMASVSISLKMSGQSAQSCVHVRLTPGLINGCPHSGALMDCTTVMAMASTNTAATWTEIAHARPSTFTRVSGIIRAVSKYSSSEKSLLLLCILESYFSSIGQESLLHLSCTAFVRSLECLCLVGTVILKFPQVRPSSWGRQLLSVLPSSLEPHPRHTLPPDYPRTLNPHRIILAP